MTISRPAMASCPTTTSSPPTGRLPISFAISRPAPAGRASDTPQQLRRCRHTGFRPEPALSIRGHEAPDRSPSRDPPHGAPWRADDRGARDHLPGRQAGQVGGREAALSGRPASVRVRIGLAAERCSYETNAFRTEEAVHRFVPWIGGTFLAFSCAAISSSDILFPSIALILMRHPKSRRLQSRCASRTLSGSECALHASSASGSGRLSETNRNEAALGSKCPRPREAVALGHLAAHVDDLAVLGKLPEDSANSERLELLDR